MPGAEWGYDNADRGSFEDRALVKIERVTNDESYGPYWRVQESPTCSVSPFKTERAAQEWAWSNSYRWTATEAEMEEWF